MAKSKLNISESEILNKIITTTLNGKKAEDVVSIDLRGIETAPADFFIIATGNVPSHTEALSDAVYEAVKQNLGYAPRRIEGYDLGEWILMDYFDVVVHIFIGAKRDFYRLEELWGDGKMVAVKGHKYLEQEV